MWGSPLFCTERNICWILTGTKTKCKIRVESWRDHVLLQVAGSPSCPYRLSLKKKKKNSHSAEPSQTVPQKLWMRPFLPHAVASETAQKPAVPQNRPFYFFKKRKRNSRVLFPFTDFVLLEHMKRFLSCKWSKKEIMSKASLRKKLFRLYQ